MKNFISKLFHRTPLLVKILIGCIMAAIFFTEDRSTTGVVLAAALTAVPGSRTRGSGNLFHFKEIDRSTSGVFTAKTAGVDALGEAFDTFHILGSHTESPMSRDDKGLYKIEVQIVENDLARFNLLQAVAPFSASTTKDAPELNLEDGTNLEGTGSTGGDTTKPYYQGIYGGPNSVAAKKRKFYLVGQFDKASQLPFKFNEWNVFKVIFQGVDANGYVCTNPAAGFTGITAPTLTTTKRGGTWVEEA